MRVATSATAGVLAGIAVLHAAWGLGSSFPFDDHATLADTVAGTDAVPDRAACFGVAGLLAMAAATVAGERLLPGRLRRIGATGVAAVLGVRGVFGLTARTSALVGRPTSPRFVELDRRFYGPLCLALACGALDSTRA